MEKQALILLFKLLVIVVTVGVVPLYYFYIKMLFFSLIMSPVFICESSTAKFLMYFFLYRILFIFYVTILLIFLFLIVLYTLVFLIHIGIVY
jgi:hypothetical protein